jgi:hypothetical protein
LTELEERASRFRRRSLWIGLGPLTLAAVQLIGSALAVSSMLPSIGALVFSAVGVLALPVAIFRAWRFGAARRGPLLGLAQLLLVAVVAFASMLLLSWPLRRLAFARAAERADPLVAAIEAFERTEGKAPEALADLIPAHLSAIPGTGLVAYPSFEYERFADAGGSLLWWDMGSRLGAPMTGLWVYPDGDAEHAILALELDGRDVVLGARTDRMPPSTEECTFSSETWRGDPNQRLHMVHDLAKKHDVRGKDRLALEALLGPPNGRRVLRDSPWELRIPCSVGILNWDVFFYWPTGRYPEQAYGGRTERIGRWAYVHE